MTVRFGPVAKICQPAINGRFWPKADMPLPPTNVCVGGKADIAIDGLLMTQSGH
jgi:hypothetical protein